MFDWLKRQLGVYELLSEIAATKRAALEIRELGRDLHDARLKLDIQSRAMGRIISKLDPIYRISEHDPARKAESDKIADEVIAKLYAEHAASNRFPQ